MKSLIARLSSPATAIACLALFVALGGVSYGFATGSIDSREIRNNTIETDDIATGAVQTRDLRDNSIRTDDLRNNEVRGRDIRNSTIRGIEIALNSIGGADIDESTLEGVVLSDVEPFYADLSLSLGWLVPTGEQRPGYDVDPLGYVHLRGAVRQAFPTEDVAAVLPAEARPATLKRYATFSRSSSGSQVLGSVLVEEDGEIRPQGPGVQELLSLDGISFRAGS